MYTAKEIEMAKRGFCYLRYTISSNGMRKVIRRPENYDPKDLIFDDYAFDGRRD